jgi:hypothetical protein
MIDVSPVSTRVCPALERNICEADCCGGAPGWANCMVVVQLEDAGGAGGAGALGSVGAAGGVGGVGGAGGAGGLKLNGKILTYYYAFQAREADQSFTVGSKAEGSTGRLRRSRLVPLNLDLLLAPASLSVVIGILHSH